MIIKVYTMDVRVPRWLKRALLFGAIPAAILFGLVRYPLADVAIPNIFADGDILSASKMNDNFKALQAGINGLGSTVTSLQASVAANSVPAGTVVAYAGSKAPAGWLLCDGSLVNRADYPALFAAIGVTYDIGDSVKTFGLPDLRGAGVRGVGESKKFASNSTVTLAQVIDDKMQGHVHRDSGHNHPNGAYNFGGCVPKGDFYCGFMNPGDAGAAQANIGSPDSDGSNGTPRTSSETTGKAVGLNFIIKY